MTYSLHLRSILACGTAFAALAFAAPAAAQPVAAPEDTTEPAPTPTGAETPDQGADISSTENEPGEGEAILVTGSRLKRDPNDSALPLQIITTQEITRNGISSPEQLVSFLTTNGTSADNLASNSDVVSGQQRGNNGASFANLRGQGSNATLVLLNGRRVAAHGLQGSAVDVNQIPFAAIERVEVLKEGASAIYGTDAIGGVINFILRNDYQGVGISGFVDAAEEGDHTIFRTSAIAGYGDLGTQGFNIMGAVSWSDIPELRADKRDFIDTFQPERGLSPDTRGSPHGTIFPLAGGPNTGPTIITPSSPALLFIPGTTIRASGGINVLDLPGGEGCDVSPWQEPYDAALWSTPSAAFACSWDTGRAASIQQELETLTYLGRGILRLGAHELFAEVTGSDAKAAKRFSHVQLIPNASFNNYAYPSTGENYDEIVDRLVAVFPGVEANRGDPIAYRWRCIECGRREIFTDTKTFRAAIGADGPIGSDWDYRVGASYASSESKSELGSGYYYRGTLGTGAPDPTAPVAPGATVPGLIGLLNTAIINPFLLPGQTQSAAALAALEAVSAEGVVLYGGKYEVMQVDGSVSGSLFRLPGGTVRAAVGVDYRNEQYGFSGDERAANDRPVIIAAPFDDVNALDGVERNIKAAYAEILFPILDNLEVTVAGRIDHYSDFGTTTNPMVSIKYRPIDMLMFRGNYNTGFRAPTFNQLFNGQLETQYLGADITDPKTCSGIKPVANDPTCPQVQPILISGGNPNLGPETAKMWSVGAVFEPSRNFSASVDFWSIRRDNTARLLSVNELLTNYDLVTDRFIYEGNELVAIDQSWVNAGASRTEGLELMVRGGMDMGAGRVAAGIDGTYLFTKREALIAGQPYGPNEVGKFSLSGDLGLRWKHNAFVSYSNQDWSVTLYQLFRNGYQNQVLPGVASGAVNPPDFNPRVSDYIVYNLSVSFTPSERMRWTFGVKNLFDRDPPFSISYDSGTGGGSSWEPRVADPRGRAFTILADVKF